MKTTAFLDGKKVSRLCLFCHPIQERVLFETDHFRVLIDTYPVSSGHIMISSKDHYGTAGELPLNLQDEYLSLKEAVKCLALQMGPSVIFYEHGKAGSCHATSADDIHCQHFHLHCLPIDVCIHQKIAARFAGQPMQNYRDLFVLSQTFGSYLFFENAFGNQVFYPAENGLVPSHFLRTLLCQALHIDTLSNWQSYNDLDRYVSSVEKIQTAYGELYALS